MFKTYQNSKKSMRLAQFIAVKIELITNDFEEFVRHYLDKSTELNSIELRNHIKAVLTYVSTDMGQDQTRDEQELKSKGKKLMPNEDSPAEIHGDQRADIGFSITDLASEYRALRANILKHWIAQLDNMDEQDFNDMIRFNEAIDEIQLESLIRFQLRVDEAKNYFLSVLGHDLRNPLSAIVGSVGMLSRSGNLSEIEKKIVGQIELSSKDILLITENLLELAKVNLSGSLNIAPKSLDMGDICVKVVDQMKAAYPDAEIITHIENNLFGEWDQMRIEQVLANLIRNAYEHGNSDSPINIIVHKTSEDSIMIEVQNFGPVISPEQKKELFQRYKSVNNGASGHHLGLGLYIAHEIVLAHGGSINVSSTEENGTSFLIEFTN